MLRLIWRRLQVTTLNLTAQIFHWHLTPILQVMQLMQIIRTALTLRRTVTAISRLTAKINILLRRLLMRKLSILPAWISTEKNPARRLTNILLLTAKLLRLKRRHSVQTILQSVTVTRLHLTTITQLLLKKPLTMESNWRRTATTTSAPPKATRRITKKLLTLKLLTISRPAAKLYLQSAALKIQRALRLILQLKL